MSLFEISVPISIAQKPEQKSRSTNPFLRSDTDDSQHEKNLTQSTTSQKFENSDLSWSVKTVDEPFQNYVHSLDLNSDPGEDGNEDKESDNNNYQESDVFGSKFSLNSADSKSNFQKSSTKWYIGDKEQLTIEDDQPKILENSPEEKSTNVQNFKPEDEINSSNLAFDTSSSLALQFFLNQYSINQKLNKSLNLSSSFTSLQSSQNSLQKSNSSASFFETSASQQLSTSPIVSNLSSSASSNNVGTMMSVASKKRGLFSRSSKQTNSTTNNHIGSSTSINDHHDENGKLKSSAAPSSPSGTSHHMNELNEERFNGDGVMFQGKLIGHEYVAEARGEQMCQQSLKKLKIIQKALGGHKRKVNMFVSFDGIKIQDPGTQEELFHHTVPQISFISRDETDTRAFGYVFGNSQTGHQFIGIKTKKEAMVVMSTIGQLFAITLKRKRSAEEAAAAAAATVSQSSNTSTNQQQLSSTMDNEEHLYHSVVDQTPTDDNQLTANAATTGSKSTIRTRLRHGGGTLGSLENVPIPALPPPSEHHHHHHHRPQQHLLNHNRFSTVGRASGQDFNNNKLQSTSSLINELDLFQPTMATGQNLASSFDSSLQTNKDEKPASYNWANFDDDPLTNDSTLNTISSISDTTMNNNNNTLTLGDQSTTLVAGPPNNEKQIGPNSQSSKIANIQQQKPLNSSSTTISSANFDGMDPFSDAFGAGDDPFSTASTTADISSNVFSTRIAPPPSLQKQHSNRPPSNPGPQTLFDSNRLTQGVKNQESHGSIPALVNSLGSLSFDQPSTSVADKYAVLADINSISTSIFDSLGGGVPNRPDSSASQTKDSQQTKQQQNSCTQQHNTPTPPLACYAQQHQQSSFQSGFSPSPYDRHQQQMVNNFGNSFCNVSYQQQKQQKPISYGVNGVVVLPPVSSTSGFQSDFNMPSGGSFSTTPPNKNQWSTTKSFDDVPNRLTAMVNFANFQSNQQPQQSRQPPRAEFDSMSNLSSTSSNASNQSNQFGTNTPNKKSGTDGTKSTEIPLFQELDPLNKPKNRPSYSPSNFIVQDKNRSSPLAGNPILDSSISSMNSSNSSLFNNNNSRNCSTPSSLHRKSPQPQHQLQMQYSLPSNPSMTSSTVNKFQSSTITTSNDLTKVVSSSGPVVQTCSVTTTTTTTTTGAITPSPHYIMLYHLSSSTPEKQKQEKNQDEQKDENLMKTNQEKENENDHSKDEIGMDADLAPNNEQQKQNNKHRSRTSSISSSSNSLLINQSNFSELKFDDVFEAPLLEPSSMQDEANSPKSSNVNHNSTPTTKQETEQTNSSHQLKQSETQQKQRLKSTDSVSSSMNVDDSELKSGNDDDVQPSYAPPLPPPIPLGRSLSRQSSNASSNSSLPAIPPRTDLHSRSNQYQNAAPPLPPPHYAHYGGASGGHHRQMTALPHHHYPLPAVPPHHAYPQSAPYYHHYYQDPYGRMPPPPPHHRYWNSTYDWPPPEPIYGTIVPGQVPLDYPPQMAPPPPISIPGTSSSSSPSPFHPQDPYSYGSTTTTASNATRPYSGGGASVSSAGSSSWHDYFQMTTLPTKQQQRQQQLSPSPGNISDSVYINHQPATSITNTVADVNKQQRSSSSLSSSPPANHPNATLLSANDGTIPPTTTVAAPPGPPPQIPNPQRRISSTSIVSNISSISATNHSSSVTSHSATAAGAASQLQRATSNVSTSSSSMIPTYPPPPPPIPYDLSSYYVHQYATPGFYEDNAKIQAQQGPSPFATFNMNMEQMIMKYHQPRSSPIYSDYPSGTAPPYGHHPIMPHHHHPGYPPQYQTPPPQPAYAARGRHYSNSQLIMDPQQQQSVGSYGNNNSSSEYYSTVSPGSMLPMDLQTRSPWTTQPSQKQENFMQWDNPSGDHQPNCSVDGDQEQKSSEGQKIDDQMEQTKIDLFDDNFACFEGQKTEDSSTNGNGFDTVKRNSNKVGEQFNDQQKKPEINNEDKPQTENIEKTTPSKSNIKDDNKVSSPPCGTVNKSDDSGSSPEERNIFVNKDDPFEDDFFKS